MNDFLYYSFKYRVNIYLLLAYYLTKYSNLHFFYIVLDELLYQTKYLANRISENFY
jgi:hypothetical protein